MRHWILAARPKTLPAALAPVLVGSALAASAGGFQAIPAVLCLGFALLVQVGTNFANDYLDHARGADSPGRVGPRRAVASGLIAPGTMKAAAWTTFAIAFLVGLGLVPFGGPWLLVVGVVSIACGYGYTGGPFPLAYHGLGDLFVVVFFGFVAVGATYFVQAGIPGYTVWLAALAVGLLASNILVVNNYRDRNTDPAAGKNTLVVILGERAARIQFWASILVSALVPFAMWVAGGTAWVLLALSAVPLGIGNALRLRPSATPPELIVLLGRSAAHLLVFAVLLSLGLVIG